VSLAGCGGGGSGGAPALAGNNCTETIKKQFVLDTARDRYLFLDLLPSSVDQSQFATATALLDSLTATARAQNRDRFFSFISTITADQQFISAGASIGFGVVLRERPAGSRLFVAQVFESSAAADAGFVRGDEILAIGTSDSTLENIGAILARSNGLSDALGASTAGIARTFRVLTPSGATVVRSASKREFSLNPVPAALVQVISRPGLTSVGYIVLRSFVTPADDPLRSAFQTFRTQGVRDIIIDLRYNGGGLVSTAEILMNLLGGSNAGQVMYRTRLNRNYTANQATVRFASPAAAQSIAPLKIAFIATEASASASELVINTLAPYTQVAIIGGRTFGKPVGQTAHDIAACDLRMRLVTFGDENRDGYGDFYSGLPPGDSNYTDDFCAVLDDFRQPFGDANEAMFKEALGWINLGVCGAAAASQQKAALGFGNEFDKEAIPTPAVMGTLQDYLPGAF
jgi:carboxyl-terminal processing protease